jgi:hypothetical protein
VAYGLRSRDWGWDFGEGWMGWYLGLWLECRFSVGVWGEISLDDISPTIAERLNVSLSLGESEILQ